MDAWLGILMLVSFVAVIMGWTYWVTSFKTLEWLDKFSTFWSLVLAMGSFLVFFYTYALIFYLIVWAFGSP